MTDTWPQDLENLQQAPRPSTRISYEFKIEGMTCVACSGAIERGMKNIFGSKGLLPKEGPDSGKFHIDVVLLLHKMCIVFDKAKAEENGVTAAAIIDEVEDLGFGAELINTTVMDQATDKQNAQKKKKQDKMKSDENVEPLIKECTLVLLKKLESAQEFKQIEGVMKQIQTKRKCIKTFQANILTSTVKVTYDEVQCSPRDLIEWLEDEGAILSEVLIKSDDSADIRKIAEKEV